METCRLCVTKARTKYELKDVKQFLSEIPFLKDLIGDVYSQNVCYTCYNSSKAAEKFLERIRKAQEKFPSVSKPIQPSNEEILRKYQGISFKKVKLPAVVEDDFDAPYLKQEHSEPTIVVDYANFEIKHEEEYLIDDGAEDYVDNDDDYSEDDNDTTDESYTPSTSKAKQSSKSKVTKQNTESTEKKQKNVGGIYLDAPTCYTCSKCKVEYATYEELYTVSSSIVIFDQSLTLC